MMRAEIKIEKPGAIPVTLTMAMTLDELREVRKALGGELFGPAGWVRDAITALERKATQAFRHDEGDEA